MCLDINSQMSRESQGTTDQVTTERSESMRVHTPMRVLLVRKPDELPGQSDYNFHQRRPACGLATTLCVTLPIREFKAFCKSTEQHVHADLNNEEAHVRNRSLSKSWFLPSSRAR